MTDLLIRRAPEMELERSGDGRTISGLVAPYDKPTLVRDKTGPAYKESIARSAFSKSLEQRPGRVKFLEEHRRDANPLGVATDLRDTDAGLYGSFRVSKTRAGDEAIELVRDGAMDGLSVGMVPTRSRKLADGTVERLQVALFEVSLVTWPAYEDATVDAIRAAGLADEELEEALSGVTVDAYRTGGLDLSGVTVEEYLARMAEVSPA